MSRQLTRQALFDLIWEQPMKQLAVEFGVTPKAISKLCDDYGIPKPGYGYWTLRDMGRPVEKPSLSVNSHPPDQMIIIEAKPPRIPKPSPPIKPKRTATTKSAPSEELPAAVAVEPEPSGVVANSTAPAPELGDPDRQAHVLALLQTAIEARGWTGKLRKPPYKIMVDGEPLALELIEQYDRIAHVKTEKEIAALRKFEEDRIRAQRAGRWFSDWDRPKIAEWDYVLNGKLTLKFEAGWHHHGLRRSFSDGKRQRLEGLIDTIVEAFAAYAQGEKDHRVEVERRRLEAIEEEKRRREAERRHVLETKRMEFLTLQMERHEAATRIESFLGAYPVETCEDEKVAALLAWAKRRAGRLRALLTVETLREKLDRNDLMNEAAEVSSWRSVE